MARFLPPRRGGLPRLPIPIALKARQLGSARAVRTPAPASSGTTGHSFRSAPVGARPPGALADAVSALWLRQVVEVVNNLLRGKLNAGLQLTLATNAASTTIVDQRISAFSAVLFCPLTADAAAEMAAGTLFVSSLADGQAVIAHQNNALTDRTYNLCIIG